MEGFTNESKIMEVKAITPKIEIGKILDQSFSFYFNQLHVMLSLGLFFALLYLFPEVYEYFTGTQIVLSEEYYKFFGVFEYFFVCTLLVGAVILACRDWRMKSTIAWWSVLGDSSRQVHKIIGAYFLVALSCVLSCIVLIIPLFIVAAALSCVMPVLMIERTSIIESFRRSAALTKGNRGRILGLAFASYFIVFIAGMVITLVFKLCFFLGGDLLSMVTKEEQIINAFMNPVVYGFPALSNTFLYFDLRDKKEGLDLETLHTSIKNAELAPVQ